MQTGQLVVTGTDFTSIVLSGRPREVFVRFKAEQHHVPCNPHHKDHLAYEIVVEDEDLHEHSKLEHRHHDRKFFLLIEWEVQSVREIDWIVIY